MRYAVVQRYFDDGECTAEIIPLPFSFKVVRFRPCRLYDQYTDIFEDEEAALDFKTAVIKESNGEKINPPLQRTVPRQKRKWVIF